MLKPTVDNGAFVCTQSANRHHRGRLAASLAIWASLSQPWATGWAQFGQECDIQVTGNPKSIRTLVPIKTRILASRTGIHEPCRVVIDPPDGDARAGTSWVTRGHPSVASQTQKRLGTSRRRVPMTGPRQRVHDGPMPQPTVRVPHRIGRYDT